MNKLILSALFILGIVKTNGQSCQQLAEEYFSCGIPTAEFEYLRASTVNYGAQVQSNWCWAACVQMVLNYHGLYVNQMDVVTRIYGSPYFNKPANEQQILAALSGWALNVYGTYSNINADGGTITIDEIINDLSGKWPLIVGLPNEGAAIGHAYVLTAINFWVEYDEYGNVIEYIPDYVVLRDPWPLNPSRKEMSWYEFEQNCFMALRVSVNTY